MASRGKVNFDVVYQPIGCEMNDTDAWERIEGFHPSLQERWAEYDSHDRRWRDLLDRDELTEARKSQELLATEVRAFCLLSSIQEAWDMAYWVQVNRSSEKAAVLLAEFLLNSPLDHDRPRFRAARALELFDRTISEKALSAAKSAGGPADLALNSELINAALTHSVEEYARKTPHVRSEESRTVLLTEYMDFPPSGEVRLISFS